MYKIYGFFWQIQSHGNFQKYFGRKIPQDE